MTEIKEYLNNYTFFYTIEFQGQQDIYFLLFDSNSEWAKKFSDYLTNLNHLDISKSKDSKNIFYFSCETFNQDLINLRNVKLSNKEFIQKICKTHFYEKAFLIKDQKDRYFINFNLDSILKNPNIEILGIFLNPLDYFIKFLDDNQHNLDIVSVNKFNDITGKNKAYIFLFHL